MKTKNTILDGLADFNRTHFLEPHDRAFQLELPARRIKPQKDRKVHVERAGTNYWKARWEGRSDFAFGPTKAIAKSRLKMFGNSQSKHAPVFKKLEEVA
jgi:hypothetical protein